jgi:hypothetical protein
MGIKLAVFLGILVLILLPGGVRSQLCGCSLDMYGVPYCGSGDTNYDCVACPGVCSDIAGTDSDSDAQHTTGLNFFVAGTCASYRDDSRRADGCCQDYTSTDSCSGNILTENYLGVTGCTSQQVDCSPGGGSGDPKSYACSGGVCIIDNTAPVISVIGAPGGWTNSASVSASISCNDGGSGCDAASYRLRTYSTNPGTCSNVPGEYTLPSPSVITTHEWVCGYGEDRVDNPDFSDTPTEFRIDRMRPEVLHNYAYNNRLVDFPVSITFTLREHGDSGIQTAKWCDSTGCDASTGATICSNCANETTWVRSYDTSGMRILKVWVSDRAGNTNQTEVIVIMALLGPPVSITANPSTVVDPGHIWQRTDATAKVSCDSSNPLNSNCGETLQIVAIPFTGPMTSCSEEDYSGSRPGIDITIPVTQHSWVCGRAAASRFSSIYGYTPPIEFFIDKDPPNSWIMPFASGWTNETLGFLVRWGGSDNVPIGSGITIYNVSYRITWTGNGSLIKSWTTWEQTSREGDMFYATVHGVELGPSLIEGATYWFRANALDAASNWELIHLVQDSNWQSMSVDRVSPSCMFNNMGSYTNNQQYYISPTGVKLGWTGMDDQGGSGIGFYNIYYNASSSHGSCGFGWRTLIAGTTETSGVVTNAQDDCTYYFRCEAVDVAGNARYGDDSASTTVDLRPPETSPPGNVRITRPSVEWATQGFNLTWDGTDYTSGIECYDVQWNDDPNDVNLDINWQYIQRVGVTTQCLSPGVQNYIMFDSSVTGVGNIVNGRQFFFRLRATDRAGNQMAFWIITFNPGDMYPLNVTIDTERPEVEIVIRDQNGNPVIGKVVSSESVTQLNITSIVRDSLSGVQTNVISYDILSGNLRILDSVECGSGTPYGGTSECMKIIEYAEDVMVKYQIISTDRAGNVNQTKVFYIVTHPLANFVGSDVAMTIGDNYIAQVQTRNLLEVRSNVTVWLMPSSYSMAGFVDTGSAEIQQNGRVLIVELNPDEEKTFLVKILSGDPGSGEEILRLNATTSRDLDMKDNDTLNIITSFPVSFPGTDNLASLLIMALAVPVYLLTKRKKLA